MKKPESFTVTLPWPPSTNRIWRNVAVRGKPITLLSEEGRRYRTNAAQMCMLGGVNNRQLAGRLAVSLDDSQIDLLSVERAEVVKGGELRVTISVKEAA
ncbi:hypothetical protein [Aeromonas hydrophila]|uniref:hypothetical protein n=1 Tax=Aeromonas hydrophila TaxID=644 RepID=UPI002360CADE|nr:hypothetical protein [Aeromonas hydrophila]